MKNGRAVATPPRVIDIVSVSFLFFLFILTLLFPARIPNTEQLRTQLVAAATGFIIVGWFRRRWTIRFWNSALRTVEIMVLCTFFFKAMEAFQHILVEGWLDGLVIKTETSLFGIETSQLLQKLVSPMMTEGMMFAYVSYGLLIPAVAFLCYRAAGEKGVNDYLLNLLLAYFVCYIGFILFPLASPLFYAPQRYTVQLHGGFFAWCGEWVRANEHFAGGSLPSPHCAAGTVMIAMLYRYNRKAFFIVLPTMLLLYVSTVYGRYHYTWDGITGIVSAVFVVVFSPRVTIVVERIRRRVMEIGERRTTVPINSTLMQKEDL